jgi:hypothetical protein
LRARAVLLFSAAVVALAAPRVASAHPGITGYSGKPYNGMSETCTTNCHAKGGANPPTLTITVPSSVVAGSTSQVTVAVAGTRVRTSFNAAFSDGVKTIKGTNTDTPLPAQEPTEVGAVVPPPSGASASYKFSFIAPSTPGAVTMYVAGMAANGAGTNGDAVTTTTRTITVTAPDAGAATDAGSSGGSDASASGGTSGTSGTSASTDGGGSSGTSGTASSSSGKSSPASGDDGDAGGCAVSPRARGNALDSSLLALTLGVALAACARRRTRSRRRA